jgi:hypothetical protein
MSQQNQSQSGTSMPKDQKPADTEKGKEGQKPKSPVGEQHETGSASNSQPGSGPG